MTQELYPSRPDRQRAGLSPLQSLPRMMAANSSANDGPTILEMLKRLTFSQWMVLLYPLFLWIVHRRRDEADVSVVDESAMVQIAFTAVCGTWMLNRLLVAMRGFERVLTETPLRWLLAYAVLAVLSASWSDMAALTAFRGTQLVVFFLVVADAIGSFRDTQDMIRLQLLYAAMSIFFWQFLPAGASLSIEKLHTSDVAGTVITATFLGSLVRGKQWRILHVCIVGLAMLSTSTGWFFACAGGITVILMMMRGRAAGLGVIIFCAFVLSVVFLPDYVDSVVFFGKNENAIASGTGRVPIWQWVLSERVSQSPVVGFGFGEGEVQARLFNIGGFRMMHMHNAFMSAIVNLGILGVAIWAVMWAAMVRTAWSIREHRARLVLVGGCVALFINTLSMESVTAPISMPWLSHAMFFTALAIGVWDDKTQPVKQMARLAPIRRRFGAQVGACN